MSAAAPQRPWWSRSKSSKDLLRPNRSFSNLGEADEKPSHPNGGPKHKDSSAGLKFNTIVSAMGLKPKKVPALTIQDPPSPLYPPNSPYTSPPASSHGEQTSRPQARFYTNRPPAKSVSTVRSSEYDYEESSDPHTNSEPRTPSDHPRDRMSYQHSVMTLSEDPFVSSPIVVRHMPQDPNRLSAYSDSSVLDPQHPKRNEFPHRTSYASTSSNSHSYSSDGGGLPLSPLSVSSFGHGARSRLGDLGSPSEWSASDSRPPSTGEQQRTRARLKTPSNSSASTVASPVSGHRVRGSQSSQHLNRKGSVPNLSRPRGMTVSAVGEGADFTGYPPVPPYPQHPLLSPIQPLQPRRKASGSGSPSSSNTPSPSPVVFTRTRSSSTAGSTELPSPLHSPQPVVVVRKASSSRMKLPPLIAAPPTTDLPPPPIPAHRYHDLDDELSPVRFMDRSSSSSSSLNFAPSVDLHGMDPGDAILELMNDTAEELRSDLSARRDDFYGENGPSQRGGEDADGLSLSPVSLSPMAKFPPVPPLQGLDSGPPISAKLKKVSSQQKLAQRLSSTSIASSTSFDDTPSTGQRTPKKQRSFHHSRIPLPPLPSLRQGGAEVASHSTPPSASEPRRTSITSPRKRLFSGSSARRSTSSHGPTSPTSEDDTRSVFSLDDSRTTVSGLLETISMSFGAAANPLSFTTRNACISPYWGDPGGGSVDPPPNETSQRTSQSEYVPQYIMDPAQMLKLEEEFQQEAETASLAPTADEERKPKLDLNPRDFGVVYTGKGEGSRARSSSILSQASTGTLAFGNTVQAPITRGASVLSTKSAFAGSSRLPLAGALAREELSRATGPVRSSSLVAKSPKRLPPISMRPSTAQPRLTPPTSPVEFGSAMRPDAGTSLPPPPRRRPSNFDLNQVAEPPQLNNRASVVPINPLAPPPRSRPPSRPSTATVSAPAAGESAMSRPPSSFNREKIMKRRSLMKKPSFLEIDDELELDMEEAGEDDSDGTTPSPASPVVESSFLDMDRKESFDTVRSADSAIYVS